MTKTLKKRVSKDQWLALALDVLAVEGITGVKIERLAKKLGITKSGFYWHFKNRDDLLAQMLEYWRREFTTIVSGFVQEHRHHQPADQQLLWIMTTIYEKGLYRYEIPLRAWAMQDEKAREVLQEIDDERYMMALPLFKELGYKGKQLVMVCQVFLCYQAWMDSIHYTDEKLSHGETLKLRWQFFIDGAK